MKRPLVPVALFYAGGLLAAEKMQPAISLLFACGFIALAIGIVWPAGRRWSLCALLLIAGWTNSVSRSVIISPVDLRLVQGVAPELVTLTGVLKETPSAREYVTGEQERTRTL